MGSGHSYIHHNNGIIISHWQGEFRTEGKEEYMTFEGRDVNKNGKFVVLRTYFKVANFRMDEWFGLYIEWKGRNFYRSIQEYRL